MRMRIAISLYILATILYGVWAFGTDEELYLKLKDVGKTINELELPMIKVALFLAVLFVIFTICLAWPIWIIESFVRATITLFRRSE